MKIIKNLLKSVISSLYPNKCICCGEFIAENRYICDNCDKLLERNNLDNLCLLCGLEKENCVCKYNIYRFDALLCLYQNTGLAQDTYYKYKFAKKQHYARFLATEMADAVKYCFGDIKFDFICSVPSFRKFMYNHCDYLAQEISRNLNVPFAQKLLSCVKRTKKQHKSTIKERLRNTDDKYRYNYRIDGARILLVDDIKTTGATLDECAKTLLFAGAQSVHCVATLGTTN